MPSNDTSTHPSKRPRLTPPKPKLDIPSSLHYHVSYAHRSTVTFIIYLSKHDMVLTASQDGVVKFWKRTPVASTDPANTQLSLSSNLLASNDVGGRGESGGKTGRCLEFVKSYVAHTAPPMVLVGSHPEGDTAASVGEDNRIKFYDVGAFDVTGMIQVDANKYVCGGCAAFVGEEQTLLAVSADANRSLADRKGAIYIFSSLTLSMEPVRVITLHAAPVTAMKYNYTHHCMISADSKGVLEYWNGSMSTQTSTSTTFTTERYQSSSSTFLTDYDTMEDVPSDQQQPHPTSDTNTEQQEANISAHAMLGTPATPSQNSTSFTSDSKITSTDLYTLLRKKTYAVSLDISPDGQYFCVYGADRRVRLFDYHTGKVKVRYDERMEVYDAMVTKRQNKSKTDSSGGGGGGGGGGGMDAIDYGKRAATERELEETTVLSAPSAGTDPSSLHLHNQECGNQSLTIQFDPTGNYLLLPTVLGIKVIEWRTNKCRTIIGRADASGLRFLGGCLCPGDAIVDRQMALARSGGSTTAVMRDPNEESKPLTPSDALFVTTAFKKRRLYIFSHLDPLAETEEDGTEGRKGEKDGKNQQDVIMERDVLNEPPDADDMMLSNLRTGIDGRGSNLHADDPLLGSEAVLRTTMGDIHIKLFPEDTPRTCENFCGHSRSGYYDEVVFHRVIKGFMIQTGDPLGNGTGGESIWGSDFEDEFVRDLRHDRAFTVSMANAGPGTNGSQFFITTVPTPWLDNKHTVFGRVTRGMDVCSLIENVKVDETDKPYEEIKIQSVDIL